MLATEKRLIDAIALISKARRMETTDNNGIPVDTFAVPVMAIEDAPTVDAVEVKHGHWINKSIIKLPFADYQFECSECGCIFYHAGIDSFAYCPFCGAKMDGGTVNG